MKYFSVAMLILLVLSLSGCYYLNVATSPYTIELLNATNDLMVILNGTIVDHEGFTPREGVNKLTIIKDSQPIWAGQWTYNDGTIHEFIEELGDNDKINVTTKRNRTIGIELNL